jgi:iron complex outermembrane receptor protein
MMGTLTFDRSLRGTATSLAALATALIFAPAAAQTAPVEAVQQDEPATADQDKPEGEIIVTGTRILSSGFTAPTPTTVIGEEQIANNAQPNIFNTIAQLPSLQGSTGAATGTFSTSSGQQGLSSFSLRGLQPIRTLTLLDGQRVVGANVTGVPDISMFPQLLVKRVDVVNGGAFRFLWLGRGRRRGQFHHRYALHRLQGQCAGRHHQIWRR